MQFTEKDIAHMVIDPVAGPAFAAKKICSEWEPKNENKSLLSCLNEVVDQYAKFTDNEVSWDTDRKILAVIVEIKLRIKPIESKPKSSSEDSVVESDQSNNGFNSDAGKAGAG